MWFSRGAITPCLPLLLITFFSTIRWEGRKNGLTRLITSITPPLCQCALLTFKSCLHSYMCRFLLVNKLDLKLSASKSHSWRDIYTCAFSSTKSTFFKNETRDIIAVKLIQSRLSQLKLRKNFKNLFKKSFGALPLFQITFSENFCLAQPLQSRVLAIISSQKAQKSLARFPLFSYSSLLLDSSRPLLFSSLG